MSQFWTEERHRTMVDMLNAGHSFEHIGSIVGMSRYGVAHHAAKYGMRSSYSIGRWTPKKVEELISHFEAGLSARMIAEQLGDMSRNAVIGKLTRMGLMGGGSFKQPENGARTKRVRKALDHKQERRQEVPAPQLRVADVVPMHVSLLDLKHNMCRYPFGDGPFTFCGCPVLDGLSYCEPHQRLTHSTGRMTVEEVVQGKRAYRAKMIAEVA